MDLFKLLYPKLLENLIFGDTLHSPLVSHSLMSVIIAHRPVHLQNQEKFMKFKTILGEKWHMKENGSQSMHTSQCWTS